MKKTKFIWRKNFHNIDECFLSPFSLCQTSFSIHCSSCRGSLLWFYTVLYYRERKNWSLSCVVSHPTSRNDTAKNYKKSLKTTSPPSSRSENGEVFISVFFRWLFPYSKRRATKKFMVPAERKKKSSVAILHSENLLVCDKTWHFRVSDDLGCRAFFVSFSQQCRATPKPLSPENAKHYIEHGYYKIYREKYMHIRLLCWGITHKTLIWRSQLHSSLLCALKSIELSIWTTRQHRSSIELIQARMSI